MAELVAFLSGKGGTGKTSVCAGVSVALARMGMRVLCVDCDIGLRNLDISLGMTETGTLSFLDVCQGGYTLAQAPAHPGFPSLHFLTAPVNQSPASMDGMAFTELLSQARRDFDYVMLDAPGGVEAGFRLAAANADRVVLVTGADPGAVRDATRTGQVLEKMGKENIRLVVNRVERRMVANMDITVDDIMDSTGLPLLGLVPEDPNVTLAAAFGQSLLTYSPRSDAAQAFRRIARRIQGLPTPITVR